MEHYKKAQLKKHAIGYVIGFVLSLIITLVAFWMVYAHTHGAQFSFPSNVLIPMLGILAFSQFVVQLVYFLHLGTEQKPRWKLVVFWFMVIVVLIVVVGSLWIMQNLNYNMMPAPENMNLQTQKGL
ncbi:cytochrome o ubiquinol oxidase subunit IV [Candidatus Saccharibacteria bacterium]|nr:cytochrome o ubiquinol oxidase subunit IV [Candidatus Saccharibacteria bacterium]